MWDSINRKKSYKMMPTFSLIYKREDWFNGVEAIPSLPPWAKAWDKGCLCQQLRLERCRNGKLKEVRNRDGVWSERKTGWGPWLSACASPYRVEAAWFLSCVSSY